MQFATLLGAFACDIQNLMGIVSKDWIKNGAANGSEQDDSLQGSDEDIEEDGNIGSEIGGIVHLRL